jgi:hypothetical protein
MVPLRLTTPRQLEENDVPGLTVRAGAQGHGFVLAVVKETAEDVATIVPMASYAVATTWCGPFHTLLVFHGIDQGADKAHVLATPGNGYASTVKQTRVTVGALVSETVNANPLYPERDWLAVGAVIESDCAHKLAEHKNRAMMRILFEPFGFSARLMLIPRTCEIRPYCSAFLAGRSGHLS